MSHRILPRRFGRHLTCTTILEDGKPCGRDVQYVRHKVQNPFWRHTGSGINNLHEANRERQRDAGNI